MTNLKNASAGRCPAQLGKLGSIARLATLGTALALLCVTGAGAQDRSLRGIDNVTIQVSELDERTKTCGIAAPPLEAAIRMALSRSRLRALRSNGKGGEQDLQYAIAAFTAPQFQVGVMALPVGQGVCAASVHLEVSNRVYFDLRGEIGSQGLATVWSTTNLMVAPQAGLGRQVTDKLDTWVVNFLGDWSKAN